MKTKYNINSVGKDLADTYTKRIEEDKAKKYVKEGILDRVTGRMYNDLKYSSQYDKTYYNYGYYERGNLAILMLILAGKHNDITSKDLKQLINNIAEIDRKSNDIVFEELPDDLEQLIAKIAERDGMNSEIIFEELPKGVQNNKIYSEYYNNAYLSRNKMR